MKKAADNGNSEAKCSSGTNEFYRVQVPDAPLYRKTHKNSGEDEGHSPLNK